MGLIVDAEIAHPDLALTPTIEAVPETTIRVIPHSTTDPETRQFFFMIEDGQFDEFEAVIESDHTVAESLLVAESAAGRIYRLRHTDETKLLSPKTVAVGGLMLEAESTRAGWSVRLQLPDREALSRLWEFCRDEGIAFELRQLYRRDDWRTDDAIGLTEAQRTALVTAYDEGYFREPRDTSLEELADALDISPSAVGGRIRRGTATLVESTLVEE
ncbi:helix-turn-helix domain-containing protein [Halobacteriales archaeon QS_4_69_34]|jgi:predicted DNA binding protein|nr:MAG: helix-turn-helix domain-containing protein [Halobacteriales archaeon QS_4_69_34]